MSVSCSLVQQCSRHSDQILAAGENTEVQTRHSLSAAECFDSLLLSDSVELSVPRKKYDAGGGDCEYSRLVTEREEERELD